MQSAPARCPVGDEPILAGRGDLVLDLVADGDPVGLRQEVHRLHDAVELSAGHEQVTRQRGPDGEDHRVEAGLQLLAGDVAADVDAAAEDRALGLHLGQAAIEDRLLHLELGDAITQQAPGSVGPLVDRHGVAGPGELLGDGQTGRAGADDRHGLRGEPLGRKGLDALRLEGPLDGGHLDLLDGDGRLVDPEHAGGLAGRRAQTTGELREVVRGVQSLDRAAPVTTPGQVIPLRDEVAERTTAVAERDPAVHAPARLTLQYGGVLLLVDLFPVANPHRDRPPGRQLALASPEKALGVSHGKPP